MSDPAVASSLHPVIVAAAGGTLPSWASANAKRLKHMARVASLLERWSEASDLGKADRLRWRSLGYLHDCLKGVPADRLKEMAGPEWHDLPDSILHGPAAAALLSADGVDDEELVHAVRYHTLGHPTLGHAGLALYAADFLEPGRSLRKRWRASLIERMPDELDTVVAEVVQARVLHLVRRRRRLRPETVAFWNSTVGGDAWASGSAH